MIALVVSMKAHQFWAQRLPPSLPSLRSGKEAFLPKDSGVLREPSNGPLDTIRSPFRPSRHARNPPHALDLHQRPVLRLRAR
jgi:hypothetical protein